MRVQLYGRRLQQCPVSDRWIAYPSDVSEYLDAGTNRHLCTTSCCISNAARSTLTMSPPTGTVPSLRLLRSAPPDHATAVHTNDCHGAVAYSSVSLLAVVLNLFFVVALFFDSLYYGYHRIVETMDHQGYYIHGLIYSLHLLFLHVTLQSSGQVFYQYS